ncbi:1-acyl-sn-glycerol-3-phosphate acyltransferase [bacterium]|nr:1-acyl-sn-glycerol-3-phosphate acyltransferase [bacterium]
MYFHTPLRQIGSEMAFRSTIIPFSRAFWDVELLGGGVLPAGPCFFYGNHSNNYDPFILNAFTELGGCTAGVMTLEYLRRGPLASLFKASGIVGTQKRVPEPHLIRQIWKMANEGRRIVIFPEGGRRWDGRPAPWIESTAKLFMKLGIPVYPIRIHGSYVGWPRWATYPRPAHIKLEVCPAIDFSGSPSLQQGIKLLKEPISFDENVVDDHIKPGWAYKPAQGITKLLYRDLETGSFGGYSETGTHLIQKSRPRSWKVLPDSTLMDEQTGQISLTSNWYAQIKSLPLPSEADHILRHRGRYRFESLDGNLKTYRHVIAELGRDHIKLFNGEASDGESIPFEHILYTGLEKSSIIWIMTRIGTFHIELFDGSVLAWQDVLNTLIPELNC